MKILSFLFLATFAVADTWDAYVPDPTNAENVYIQPLQHISGPYHHGSGSDALVVAGLCTGEGTYEFEVLITEANPGGADKFKWQVNDGTWTENVTITGSAQTLSNGVTIQFPTTDGHEVGDQFVFFVKVDPALTIKDVSGTTLFVVHNDGTIHLDADTHISQHLSIGIDEASHPNAHVYIVVQPGYHALKIDGETNPLQNQIPLIEIRAKSAAEGSTMEDLYIDIDGYSSTRAFNILYKLTNLVVGDIFAVHQTLINTTGATGGIGSAFNVQKTGEGTVDVAALLVGTGIFPIVTLTGNPSAPPEQAWLETAGPTYADATAAFSNGLDIPIFVNQNDYIYVGNASAYYQIDVLLGTVASSNLNLTFEYSTVAGWTIFSPNDGTLGFTRAGTINWDKAVLLAAGWAARSVNGVSKYYIRVRRTRATVTTVPIENSIYLSDGVVNQWDDEGILTINKINSIGAQTNTFVAPIQIIGTKTVHTTCDASGVGVMEMFDNGANKTSLCVCEKTGVATFSWGAVTPGGSC